MDTPTPPAAKNWTSIARNVVIVIAIVVIALIYFGRKIMMGTKYKVSAHESVNYSEKATEDDAKKLAAVMKKVGLFNGSKESDILLKIDDKEGTVVSVVGWWDVNKPEVEAGFREIGAAILAGGFNKPLIVRLLDDHLNTLKDYKIE